MELTVEQALQQAIEAHKSGRLQEAEKIYRAILQAQPKHPDANHNLGVLAVSIGKPEAALPLLKTALEAQPKQGQFWISFIDALIKTNRIDDARQVLKQARQIGLSGNTADALSQRLFLLEAPLVPSAEINQPSITFNAIRKKNASKKTKMKAIKTTKTVKLTTPQPGPSQLVIDELVKEYKGGQYILAEKLALAMTQSFPNYQPGWKVLGAVLQSLGKVKEAIYPKQRAVQLLSQDAEAHNNLGVSLRDFGHLEAAEASCRQAVHLKPDFAEATRNLGLILADLGRLPEAEECIRKVLEIQPQAVNLLNALTSMLLAQNKAETALELILRSLSINESDEAKSLFTQCVKNQRNIVFNWPLYQKTCTALLVPWCEPLDLSGFACCLLKLNPKIKMVFENTKGTSNSDINRTLANGEIRSDLLLNILLTSTLIVDAEIEIFLTGVRSFLLEEAGKTTSSEEILEKNLGFYSSLAQQCFINEYVYFYSAEEVERATSLKDRLTTALKSAQEIPAIWVITVACYFPLYSIEGTERLLQLEWPEELKSILILQIQEPKEELKLRSSISCLTTIDNKISLSVQSQYEEHPYPRWKKTPKSNRGEFINLYLQKKFPLSEFNGITNEFEPEILIAGCGTGQHSIGTAQSIKGAKLLAVDLSMGSLSYAKRKTKELGIDSIEYFQADLLNLDSIGRTFDVIESVGVLHHLEQPLEGWRVLLSLLRPNGLMRLGFYSELARCDIVKARNVIKQNGINSSSNDIREFRKKFYLDKSTGVRDSITKYADFWSTSMCRDLLFHVQEQRMTLGTIAGFLQENTLVFLGFDINPAVIQSYRARFFNDQPATNLQQWQIYEEENPDTFSGMYQFWIQKKI